jgi:hypothetical protein
MKNKLLVGISTMVLLGGCASPTMYTPDAGLMGTHMITHGNSSSITDEGDAIHKTIVKFLSKTPVKIEQYGSTSHIRIHLRNIKDNDGMLDNSLHEILHQLSMVTAIHKNTAITLRHSIKDLALSKEINTAIEIHLKNEVRYLSFIDKSNQNQRNVKKPFNNNPDMITLVMYPTMLPVPKS